MVINFSFVAAQTVGIKIIQGYSYEIRFFIALFPLIFVMASFPFISDYLSENIGWAITNLYCVVIGKTLRNNFLGLCLGLFNSILMGLCGLLTPQFVGANL